MSSGGVAPPEPAFRHRTALLTASALVAFAANSVLCRLALRPGAIDAASFSVVRLTSGAVVLAVLARLTRTQKERPKGSWFLALALLAYAVPFSFAYVGLSTGTGALILFGSVQITMMIGAVRSGERPHGMQWVGLTVALAGLVYLVLPGIAAPPLLSALLMTLAGLAWGVYSLKGRGSEDPLGQTTDAFVRSLPFVFLLGAVSLPRLHAEIWGISLAVASGALASGLGYVTWYAALRGLTATKAAVVQLSVPVLAALGGVLFLGESVSSRLVLSSLLVLGGVALGILWRSKVRAL